MLPPSHWMLELAVLIATDWPNVVPPIIAMAERMRIVFFMVETLMNAKLYWVLLVRVNLD
jgi:hypothetical protein